MYHHNFTRPLPNLALESSPRVYNYPADCSRLQLLTRFCCPDVSANQNEHEPHQTVSKSGT